MMRVQTNARDQKQETYKYTDLEKLTCGLEWTEQERNTHTISGSMPVFIHDTPVVPKGMCTRRSITIHLEDGACGTYIHELSELEGAVIDEIDIFIPCHAVLDVYHLHMTSILARTDFTIHLTGPHAKIFLNGIQVLKNSDHGDMTVTIHHEAPETTSRQIVRHVVDSCANGVYQGKIIVHPGAQKTNATQTSKAILLSSGAQMNTKPELEIYADDVQCSHGATTGALDPSQVFYLMSRGLSERTARSLLISGFINEPLMSLPEEKKEELVCRIQQELEKVSS